MTLQEMLTIALRYHNKQSDALIIACFDAARERGEHLTILTHEGGDTDGNRD